MRILVVDDDQATRLCLVKVLGPAGEVDSVTDGTEAVEAFDRALAEGRPFGLVCMDINMPRMDGQEALRKLRELEIRHKVVPGEEVKVIMISACGDTGNVCDAYFHGQAEGFVKKPLRLPELKEELHKVGLVMT